MNSSNPLSDVDTCWHIWAVCACGLISCEWKDVMKGKRKLKKKKGTVFEWKVDNLINYDLNFERRSPSTWTDEQGREDDERRGDDTSNERHIVTRQVTHVLTGGKVIGHCHLDKKWRSLADLLLLKLGPRSKSTTTTRRSCGEWKSLGICRHSKQTDVSLPSE